MSHESLTSKEQFLGRMRELTHPKPGSYQTQAVVAQADLRRLIELATAPTRWSPDITQNESRSTGQRLMGYFPNGTAGLDYEDRYCSRCIHNDPDKGCPVWMLHMLHNYDECNNPESFLHVLIPRCKDRLDNEQCSMFVRVPGL